MPLITSSFETLAADIKAGPTEVYVIFSGAKGEDGQSWCPPCREAEPDFQRIFANGETYGILVPFEIEHFNQDLWPKDEWAVRGVPTVYRLKDGEPSGAFCDHSNLSYGEQLDAYVSGEDKYEFWMMEKRGDNYIDAATRLAWNREDYNLDAVRAKEDDARAAYRESVMAKRAAQRKADKTNGTTAPATEAKINGVAAGTCNGVTCSA